MNNEKDQLKTLKETIQLKLDESFIQECNQDKTKIERLEKAVKELVEYGENLKSKNESDYKLFNSLLEELLKEHGWENATHRQSLETNDKLTEDEMKERQELIKQWETLTKRGEEEGWLVWDIDYDESRLVTNENDLHPTRKIIDHENSKVYAQRLENILYEVYENLRKDFRTIEKARSILDALNLKD